MMIKEKLEDHCPHFEILHTLLEDRANMNPHSLGVLGLLDYDKLYEPNASPEEGDNEFEDRTTRYGRWPCFPSPSSILNFFPSISPHTITACILIIAMVIVVLQDPTMLKAL